MKRGLVALIAVLLAGLTPASAAACKKVGWAPIPRTTGISYFVATTAKSALGANAVRAQLLTGRTDSVAMPTGAAILVPWFYDGFCRPIPWNTVRTDTWSPPEGAAFYTGWLRPRDKWINGLPTIDIHDADQQPAWRGDGEMERVMSGSDTGPVLTSREFFDFYAILPTDVEALEKRPQALRRIEVWESAHPTTAARGIMRTILDGMRRTFADTARQPAATQQAAADTILWGAVAEGLQLSVTSGKGTEALTETQSLLYLHVQMRNVSNTPVSVDFAYATYDFEYEIDGTWYAFERMGPSLLSTGPTLTAARSAGTRIEPGSATWTILTMPLAGRSRALQLFAVTAGRLGQRFEPQPGTHVVRVRPGRALDSTRRAPVSNAVTVSLRTPMQVDRRSQSISFTSSRNTPLREFRFASGPREAQAAIRKALARPQHPALAPLLITSAALQVLEAIPMYELRLPRRADATHASLPALTNRHLYLVRAADKVLGFIGLDAYPTIWTASTGYPGPDPYPTGAVYNSFFSAGGNADPVFRTLQRLAQMVQVRGGNYEPRLLQVFGVQGAEPVPVFWLHSTSGRPDLFYRERDPDYRGWTEVESEKLYATAEFLTAASALPVMRYNEAWAISIASVCAKATWPSTSNPLIYEQAVAERGMRGQRDQRERIGWYVHFPERQDVRSKHSGATFFVDEANGSCSAVVA